MIRYFLQYRSQLTVTDLLMLIIGYAILVLMILPFHEFAHAFVAHLCGDDTAKWHGRLTLNPFVHLDLFGTLMLLLVGFGYAKPVPINPRKFRHYKWDTILVALAGPLSNLLAAIASAGAYKLCTLFVTDELKLRFLSFIFIQVLMSVNVALAVFNLLPVPPLDGSRLWSSLLPARWSMKIEQYSRPITIGLLVLLFLGVLDGPLYFLNQVFFLGIGRLVGLI